jgi:hypothetical protein
MKKRNVMKNKAIIVLSALFAGIEIEYPPGHTLIIEDNIFGFLASDQNDIEYICQNTYEFYYALTGKEKQTIFKRK